MRWLCVALCCAVAMAETFTPAKKSDLLGAAPPVANVVPALEFPDHKMRDPKTAKPWELPLQVAPFEEHVRGALIPNPDGDPVIMLETTKDGLLRATTATKKYDLQSDGSWKLDPATSSAFAASHEVILNDEVWTGGLGLSHCKSSGGKPEQWPHYGVNGPLSTEIRYLEADSKGALWVATAIGLSVRRPDGTWESFRGKQGLPYEDLTCLAIDKQDRIWIGTSMGVIQYRPYEEGRKWFYREGLRYLPDDKVNGIAVSPDGKTIYVATAAGIGTIVVKTTTLLERAQTIEKLVNARHRRLGLVAECELDHADNPTAHTIGDNDNDGLWTAYHVAAMSLCYGATKDEAAKASAKESMHAIYMLQNASGIPGLVARSVLPPEEGAKKQRQWRPTPDGKMYWKFDTSSDEIDGHFLAFYAYYQHVAQYDPEEKKLCQEQCKKLIDYIVDNNYQLIDWNGKRTRWGFWNPENLNGEPGDYIENGLNSLQMLSFLRTSYFVTGDNKYLDHYKKLILDHRYLSNVITSKREWPDENNHSDDQLGHVAWYPLLQLEKDPVILDALKQGIRRHYRIVWAEKPSFYTFVYATVDVNEADLPAAVDNLREIPTDRRSWGQKNSQRADVEMSWRPNRFGDPVLTRVLPADERSFAKWNGDPYEPDSAGDGRHEDDGSAYLLPYWMGRYHGFIAEAK